MMEYLVLIACFAILIFLKIYLVKYSYKRKLSFYTDPEEFAEEVIQRINQQAVKNPRIKTSFMNTDNLLQIIEFNLKKLPPLVEIKDKNARCDIVECLRKASLSIAVINIKNNLTKEGLIRDLKLASNTVYPFLNVLTKVRDLGNEQKNKDQDLNYVNLSMEKYYEYILSNLTQYLFPYS